MNNATHKQIYEDEGDDSSVEEQMDEVQRAIFERLGITCEEFDKLFRARFMNKGMIEWLQNDDKARQIVREIASGVLKFYGVKTTRQLSSAKTDPVWTRVSQVKRITAFRENPKLEGTAAQADWLKSLFPEGRFTKEQYETAAKHVSSTWRRYRNTQKDTIMDAAFEYSWGTEEVPVAKEERDLTAFFNLEPGKQQLRFWIVKYLMQIPAKDISVTKPPKAYVAWVKAIIIEIRGTYANEAEMRSAQRPQKKILAGKKVERELRQKSGYKSKKTIQDQDEELESGDELQDIDNSKPQVGRRKRDIVHQIDDDDDDLLALVKAKSLKKKRSASESEETELQRTKKKKSSSESLPSLLRSSEAATSKKKDDEETPVEEPTPPPKINKPKAKKDDNLVRTSPRKTEDELDFAFEFDLPSSPTDKSQGSTKKQHEKEKKKPEKEKKKKEEEITEPEPTTRRSTRASKKTDSSNNTNETEKPKKRNARDASLSGSASPQKKKLKPSNVSP